MNKKWIQNEYNCNWSTTFLYKINSWFSWSSSRYKTRWSYGTFDIDNPNNKHIWNSKVYDKIIIVSRDASCINKSNERDYKIQLKESKAEETIKIINEKINNLLKDNIYKFEDIVLSQLSH